METNISLFLSVSDESLAYLLKKKRYNDIQKILQNIATSNKTEVDQIVWESFLIERCDKDCEKHEHSHDKDCQKHEYSDDKDCQKHEHSHDKDC